MKPSLLLFFFSLCFAAGSWGQTLEYKIYNLVLPTESDSINISANKTVCNLKHLLDMNLKKYKPELSKIIEADSTWLDLIKKISATKPESKVLNEFNSNRHINIIPENELNDIFQLKDEMDDNTIDSLLYEGWKKYWKKYNSSLIKLSEIVFSPDKKKAVLSRSVFCGALCAGEYMFLVENINDEWRIVTMVKLWIS